MLLAEPDDRERPFRRSLDGRRVRPTRIIDERIKAAPSESLDPLVPVFRLMPNARHSSAIGASFDSAFSTKSFRMLTTDLSAHGIRRRRRHGRDVTFVLA
jgi:hypothetical protein